jgi:hypothetical protein
MVPDTFSQSTPPLMATTIFSRPVIYFFLSPASPLHPASQ